MPEAPEVLDPREQRLNEVLGAYLEAADAGWAPAPEGLLQRYPDLADDLDAFFRVQAQVVELASPPASSTPRANGAAHARSKEPATLPSSDQPRGQASSNETVTAVGDYESLEVIKRGGMGIVYRAWQKGAKSWVALKMIKIGKLASKADVQRFRYEIESVAKLDHPNIVKIYHVSEHDGLPYFTMKLFERGSLQDELATYCNDPRAAAQLLASVARAVHYAHQRGILHRDLKPANILLDAQGQPHVADFGLAKRLSPELPPVRPTGGPGEANDTWRSSPVSNPGEPGSATFAEEPIDAVRYMAPEQAQADEEASATIDFAAAPGLTATGAVVGTLGYMPPEHAKTTKSSVSTAADIYSLGAILYRFLAGKTLFQAASKKEAIRLAHEGVPEAPSKANPKADRRLEAICLKCLAKDPTHRYASGEALADDLDLWLKGEPPHAWQQPKLYRMWRAVRRNLFLAVVTALVSFAAAAAFFVLYYFDADREPRALEQLSARGPLTLIGERGRPQWSRWAFGEGTVAVDPDNHAPFAFSTFEFGRLELLRKPPGKSFKYSAEVRHDKAFDGGHWPLVGIYFGFTKKQKGDEFVYYWCDINFADLGAYSVTHPGTAKNGRGNSKVMLTLERYQASRGWSEVYTVANTLFPPKLDWRKVAVEVRPDNVSVFWENKPLKVVPTADLREFGLGGKWGRDGKGPAPECEYLPDGALGLYVGRGKASFRNVTIEPLQ